MKKLIYVFISLILFASCKSDPDEPQVKESAGRTLLVYMLTSGLSSQMQRNVIDMFESLQDASDSCTVMIYWDTSNYLVDSPCILKLTSDGYGNVNGISKVKYETDQQKASATKFDLIVGYSDIVKNYPIGQDPRDMDVLTNVLKDMIKLSPSQSYGLVFGSHSESWIPSNNVKLSARAFANTSPGSGVDIPYLNEALLNVGKKFDYILMDACMMGNIEVAYELRNTCNYYIASPMEVPGIGFPYSTMTKFLFSDDYRDYTTKVCEAFALYHNGLYGNCIAIDCNELSKLTSEIKNYVDKYDGSVDLSSVQHYYQKSSNYVGLSYDILDFVNKLTNNNPSSSFISQLGKTVVAKSFSTSSSTGDYPSFANVNTDRLCGMGMYIPVATNSTFIRWNSYIKVLSWGSASGWSDYIDKINN